MPEEYKDTYMRKTTTLDKYTSIKGLDLEENIGLKEFLDSLSTTGFQASELGKAIEIVRVMYEEEATIYLSMTGNVISSGLRDIIKYLVKHKKVSVITTTASGIEEDVIKSLADFKSGEFSASGRSLFEHGVGRIGNIFVPNDRYLFFERFMKNVFKELYEEQRKGKVITPSYMAKHMGGKLGEDSYLYWAWKNDVKVYCPGIVDGSIGDLAYFFKQKKPDFKIDTTDDHKELCDYTLNQEKIGAIILGGGIAKHYALNANIFRDGLDYAVYLTTAEEYTGSDSGGNEEEAKSWAKIKVNAPTVKVKADFTITFPILATAVFKTIK